MIVGAKTGRGSDATDVFSLPAPAGELLTICDGSPITCACSLAFSCVTPTVCESDDDGGSGRDSRFDTLQCGQIQFLEL